MKPDNLRLCKVSNQRSISKDKIDLWVLNCVLSSKERNFVFVINIFTYGENL